MYKVKFCENCSTDCNKRGYTCELPEKFTPKSGYCNCGSKLNDSGNCPYDGQLVDCL